MAKGRQIKVVNSHRQKKQVSGFSTGMDIGAELAMRESIKDYAGIVDLFKFIQKNTAVDDLVTNHAVWSNLAMAHCKNKDYVSSEECWRAAIAISDSAELRYYLSIMQLHNGSIEEGFTNYLYRWHTNDMKPHKFSMETKGVPYARNWKEIIGKRLFVSGEQGFGDEIMFSRVLPAAIAVCESLFKLTPKPLKDFFAEQYEGTVHFSPDKLSTLPKGFIKDNYDVIVSIGDLFTFYVLEFGGFPNPWKPEYRQRNKSNKPRIGYVTSPGMKGDSAEARTVDAKVLLPLLSLNDLFSFQREFFSGIGTDMSPHTDTFLATADSLESMDCVVTIDTALAHLALSVGIPTLIIHKDYIDWRFKIGIYPGIKVLSTQDVDFYEKVEDFINNA